MAKENKGNLPSEETLANAVQSKSINEVFEDNKQTITYALLGLLAVIVIFLVYRQMVSEPKEKEAMAAMAQAQLQFERDSFALALTTPAPGAMGFADIADEYSGTKAGNLALYYAGVSYLQLGNYDLAVDYLEDFSPAGDVTPAMTEGMLGDAYAEKGDLDKAMSQYRSAVSKSDHPFTAAYYLMKVGMLSERNGDAAAAREAYQTIKDEYPNSPYANNIDKFLLRVAG